MRDETGIYDPPDQQLSGSRVRRAFQNYFMHASGTKISRAASPICFFAIEYLRILPDVEAEEVFV
jgi:hypothetical protein